jgi:two-component system OmpR family sensor kinase
MARSETASDESDKLNRRIAELEVAVRARDDFLTIAARELRNPMTPILDQVLLYWPQPRQV